MPCSCSQHAAKRLGAAYISANIADILHQHFQTAEKETRILVRGLHSSLRVAVEHLSWDGDISKMEDICKCQIARHFQCESIKWRCLHAK